MNAPNAYKACARCGLVRITRSDRGLYCRDCARRTLPAAAPWASRAACLPPNNPEWWWPSNQADPMTANAILICQSCQVRDLCLDYAIQNGEHQGIWGGLMPEERRRIWASQRRAAQACQS